MKLSSIYFLFSATLCLTSCTPYYADDSDALEPPERWVSSLTRNSDSTVKLIGKTKNYIITSVSTTKELDDVESISVGDTIEGIPIGAIKCSFHESDEFYGGEQYMWKGRYACMAGRSSNELLNAVSRNGSKRFSYIHISPVSLP